MAKMRQALAQEVARDDARVIAQYEARFSELDKLCRKANRDFLIKLDNAMLRCLGYGLLAFLPPRRPRPLLPGERRYLVNYQGPGDEHARPRVCVDHGDGRRSFEVPIVKMDGVRVYPIVHFALDQGSIGLPGTLFLQSALGLRCAMVWDCFHRLQNDLELAQADAGLLVLKLEMLQVTKLRVGPWGKQSNLFILRGAAREIFATTTNENLIFQTLFDDLSTEAGMHMDADGGSEAHTPRVGMVPYPIMRVRRLRDDQDKQMVVVRAAQQGVSQTALL